MFKTIKTSERNRAFNVSGVDTATASTFRLFPLLVLMALATNFLAGVKVTEAFVTPGGKSYGTRPSSVQQNEKFAPPCRLPCVSFRLHFTQWPEVQELEAGQGEEPSEKNEDGDKKSEAKRLMLDAERLRLEAEQLDANLTLQKIAALEEKLSNDAWLKKQKGQTVKDLYEELRQLERKISLRNSTVRNSDKFNPEREQTSSTTLSSSPETSSSSTNLPSEQTRNSSYSDSYDGDNPRKNPNLPPIAGFDDKDLILYVPVAEDVNRKAPNATLDERIGMFRDAPKLQAHFKEKIQNLLLGPLEELQELDDLKELYFDATSSKEKDSLLKKIKRLEAKMDEKDIGITVNGGSGGANDPGGIGYSNSIMISTEKLPPLTEDELEVRYKAIKALPDILVAVYLQRNGFYDLPAALSTINIEVGNGGMGANMNIVNNAATNANDETKKIENGENQSDANNDSDASFDLYENLKLAIQLDYYDLQLQLLNQALEISPMPEEVRKDYTAAFRSLPPQVRERYVTNNLGIGTLEATVILSEEEKDVDSVVEEIMKQFTEESSPFITLTGKNKKDGKYRPPEQPIRPIEYNDVEFIDRSRFLEEFFPSITRLEDKRPFPEDVDLFMADCLTSGNKPFMVTSKPERVMGGYYIRGTNQLRVDENDSTTANNKLIEEVYQRLQNHPTLKDKIEFYYILDPSPPSDEDMELEITLNPLFLITGKDSQTLYGLSSPLTKGAVAITGLVFTFLFSVGSCALNPKINTSIQNVLDSASSSPALATVFSDLQWFQDLALPLYFSFLGILFAHELGHRIVASYYKFDIGLPNVIPSLATGLGGSITPIKSPPPNNKALFDFAIAGPLLGLIVSIGLLLVGLEMTRQMGLDATLPVFPVDMARASSFGGGLIEYFLGKYTLLPDQGPGAYVGLHPFAISGWIGCTINALALLPLGHTDGGRVSLAMFGRRGAFVVKLFTAAILVLSGLFGLDDMNLLLPYVIFVQVWQRELESPIRNEVDEIDFFRGLLGISSAILVGLILIPMTS